MSTKQAGQVLAFFGLVVPAVLLPVAAYAVDATLIAGREARLQAATAQAAETAVQHLDVSAVRSSGAFTLDATAVSQAISETLLEEAQGASVDAYTITGSEITVVTSESVTLPFRVFINSVILHAHATAVLAAGYDSPNALEQQSIP